MPLSSALRMLVIEDNEDDFILLTDYLDSNGLLVEAIRVCREQELRACLAEHWDIIVSDFSMPEMNGLRALEITRQLNQITPFIYVSGTIGEIAAVTAIKSGAQDYVMKSDLGRLLPTIERELEQADLKREQICSERRLRKMSQAIRQAADSIFITDTNGEIEYVNPAFEKLTGYSDSEALGCSPAMLRSDLHDNTFYTQLWDTILKGNIFNGVMINKRKDGTLFHEEKTISPLYDEQGILSHFVSTGRDITERVVSEKEQARLKNLLETTPDLVTVISCLNDEIIYLNNAGRQMLSLRLESDYIGFRFTEIFPEHFSRQLSNNIIPVAMQHGRWKGEISISGGSFADLPLSMVVMRQHDANDEHPYVSLVARDISDIKRYEAQLQHQATHDSLTSLPNRYYFLDRLQDALRSAERRKTVLAVLFLDVDKFKRVNDTLGHSAGDEVLMQVAIRLKKCLRPTDTVARLSGDEFTIIIEDLYHPDKSIAVITKILQEFDTPVLIKDQEVFASVSLGVAIYPQDGITASDLLRHADIAMYRAKSHRTRYYQFYSPDMDARGADMLQLETELRYAAENCEFCLHFQPQINVTDREMVGIEALIRWQNPTRGLVSPADFIPLLESSNLIVRVGEWVIEEACKQYQRFCRIGRQDIRVSVNVSTVQLQDEAFLGMVMRLLKNYQVPPHALELEITENTMMQDPIRAASLLKQLNRVGVRTAIDDFGTGYSSLAYLKQFNLSTLKIDQSFVADVIDDPSDAAIVKASISLAHKLGMIVVAEGVETEEQAAFISAAGAEIAQGYFFSKALTSNEVLNFVPHQA